MVDVFEEVEGRLRSDQYSGLARRCLPWVLGVCAVALGAAMAFWGYEHFREQDAQKASQTYGEGQQALGRGDAGAAFLKFATVAKSGSPVYRTLAQMQEAGIRLTAGDTAQAAQMLDAAAATAPNQALGDAARLKSALALLDTASLTDLEARLTPLADAKRPYHILAREALAMARLRAGKFAEARGDFVVLTTSLDAPDDMRERAHAAITLIDDGAASGIPATVKTALTLPPPSPAPPASGPQTPQAGAAQ